MKNLIKKIIKTIVPYTLIKKVRIMIAGKKFYCPVCRKKIYKFRRLPDEYLEKWIRYRFKYNVFVSETFNFLEYSCPRCGATDRDRLYAIFLGEYLKSKRIKFLDIAPEKSLSKLICSFPDVKYRTADLYRKDVDDNVDVTNMNIYPDNSFDFFLCSDVLEHVKEDVKALQELYRILTPNGKGILMAPIQLDLEKDYELQEPLSNAERWHHYGQKDHVRMYSKNGFLKKVQDAGFKVEEVTVKNYSEQLFDRCGIHFGSVLYVLSKNK
jgi:SAM-dependent methyltransferase